MTDGINNEISKESFVETIPSGIGKDDFIKLASEQFTEEDREVFGDNYKEQMLDLIMYFTIFAPYPSRINSHAIAGIIDEIGSSDLSKTFDSTEDLEHTDTIIKRTQHLTERAIELGIIEQNDEGDFYIKQETVDKLLPIIDQFEEE